jgi:hypothetical protein
MTKKNNVYDIGKVSDHLHHGLRGMDAVIADLAKIMKDSQRAHDTAVRAQKKIRLADQAMTPQFAAPRTRTRKTTTG